jgi:hypothetical protein
VWLSLKKVYKKYKTPYPSISILTGPRGQRNNMRKTVVWKITASVSVGEANTCNPRGDNMHRELYTALAIPGSSIRG